MAETAAAEDERKQKKGNLRAKRIYIIEENSFNLIVFIIVSDFLFELN